MLVAPLHDRMPAVLALDQWELGLEREQLEPAAQQAMLTLVVADKMGRYRAAPLANSPRRLRRWRPLAPVSSRLDVLDVPGSTARLSDALLRLAKPIIDVGPPGLSSEEVEHRLGIAQLVWNGVVLDALGHSSPHLEQAREAVDARIPQSARRALLKAVSEIERSKRRETPVDLRLIGRVKVTPRRADGKVRVQCDEIDPPPAPTQLKVSSPRRGAVRGAQPVPAAEKAGRARWAELYAVATTFRALAPWRWLSDSEVFGVRDPASGEVGWCCVMGLAGQLAGLAVYRGDSGFDQHRRGQAGEIEDDEAAFGQDALVLAFVERAVLRKDRLRRLRELGLAFRGYDWPDFDSHAVGRLPLPLDDAEAERMITTVRQATVVTASARGDAALLAPDAHGRLLVRLPRPGPDGFLWTDERVEPPKPVELAVPEFNAARAARIRLQVRPSSLCLECDVFPMHTTIQERGRAPFAPAVIMLADARSGAIVHLQIGDGQDRDRFAQDELCAAIDALGALPAEVRVRRPTLERALTGLAAAIGVPLVVVESLPALEEARASLNQFTQGGGRTRRPRR